jgi:hypothetical protein
LARSAATFVRPPQAVIERGGPHPGSRTSLYCTVGALRFSASK